MNVGDALKTAFDPKNAASLYKAYGSIGGPAVIAFGQEKIIGAYNTEVVDNGVTYYRVLLFSPVKYQGTTFRYVFIESGKVGAAPTTAEVTYYPIPASVPVRQEPSSLAANIGSVKKGTAIGTGNGVVLNGMVRIKLRNPLNGWTYGWCSLNVVTTTAPGSTTPAKPVTKEGKPASITDQAGTTLENVVGEQNAGWAKWAMLGVGMVVIGLIIWQVAKPQKGK